VNPSRDYTLELAVSLEDWMYDGYGQNVLKPKGTLANSCAAWLSVSETSFALAPGETKRLQVNMQVPEDVAYTDSLPVHTAMLFVTQLNPREGNDGQAGTAIRLSLRSGVKVYHRFNGRDKADVEITDLKYVDTIGTAAALEMSCEATGSIWLEGRVRTEFINQETGEKQSAADQTLYCLPGDRRTLYIPLPEGLPSGNYLASMMVFYGSKDSVKAAEIEFEFSNGQPAADN